MTATGAWGSALALRWLPGAESALGWVNMKTVADLEALAGALGVPVTRRLTSSMNVAHEARAAGLTISIYVPATAEDLLALLPKKAA